MKTASGSATVTACLPKQSIALTRSASVPFKKQKKPVEHNHYKLNQRSYKTFLFYRANVLKYKFDSHGERTKTTVLPKQQSIVLTKPAGVR